MRRSAANAELTRQVEKSTPAAYERVSKDDAHLGFFHSSLSRRSSLRHRARIKWLVPEPSRTRGLRLCPRASSFSFSSLVATLGLLSFSTTLRTQVRPAIEFRLWQGGPVSTYCRFRLLVLHFTGTSIPRVRQLGHPEVRKRPWPLRRSRGDGNGGRFVRSPCLPSWRGLRLLYAVHQMLSLWSLYRSVHGAPGHNRWGVAETPLPAKTQGRTLDCPFYFLPPRFVAGWLLSVRRLAPGWAKSQVPQTQ